MSIIARLSIWIKKKRNCVCASVFVSIRLCLCLSSPSFFCLFFLCFSFVFSNSFQHWTNQIITHKYEWILYIWPRSFHLEQVLRTLEVGQRFVVKMSLVEYLWEIFERKNLIDLTTHSLRFKKYVKPIPNFLSGMIY